ncbi:hypothetical protein [Martelella sp. FOR1707]
MALIELNADWEKREFGVFGLARDAWRVLSEAERREAEALRREKLAEWGERPMRTREAG